VSLTPSFELASLDFRDDGIVAKSIDGAAVRGASLIGADGLWSTVRSLLMPDTHPRFFGATAWRTRLKRSGLPAPFAAPVVGLWLGPRTHLVHYPVRGGDELNVVAVAEGGVDRQGWSQPDDAGTLLTSFARWTKDSKSLLERARGWRSWSLYRLAPLRHWSKAPVALLGDAAHPVLPFLAQGAALAIEDAVALAGCIATGSRDTSAAFASYEALRRPRTTRVQHLSQRFGRLYHLRGPLRVARNLLLERRSGDTALQRFDWLYGRLNEGR
jgi:salicylate hydroxylase